MRKFLLAFAALLSITLGASAQTPSYCLPSAIGYASGVTGGAGKSVTLVTNQSQLATAVKNGNLVVLPKELFHYKPNDRWDDSYEYLAKIIYPEIFR